MQLRFPNIGQTIVIPLHFLAQPFELSSADIFQVGPFRPARRRFVKINRNPVPLPDFLASSPRQRHAIFQRNPFDRNKGHYVSSANARVRPAVFRQIDQLQSFAHAQQGRLGNRVRITRQRNHAAVMIRVHLAIKYVHPGHFAHRRDNRIHLRRVAPLGKIRHALNQSFRQAGSLIFAPHSS